MIEARWYTGGQYHPITVIGYLGEVGGRQYVSILDSSTGVPIDEITVVDPDSPYIGLWVDNHGRLHTTE